MKKFSIILINLVLFCIVIVSIESFSFLNDIKTCKIKPAYSLQKEDFDKAFKQNKIKAFRPVVGKEYKKSPIIILGCSFAYGEALKQEETFGNQLSEISKRPVYNYALPSWGIQHAYYEIKNLPKVAPEPKYIFYVFINDHIRRMYVNCNRIDDVKHLKYVIEDGKLIRKENRTVLNERFHFLSSIDNLYFKTYKQSDKTYQLFKLYLLSLQDEIGKKYPNSKFVVLDYENKKSAYLTPSKKRDLRKKGVEIVDLNDLCKTNLFEEKYKNPKEIDSFKHPNGKAWALIVKNLAEKYNL